jgi:hypothetical protein
MPDQVAGFPYWEVRFDEHGQLVEPAAAHALLADLPAQAPTDLFVFSHGWNSDRQLARDLYARYFAQMRAVLEGWPAHRPAKIGTVGVLWPSMRWADEVVPAAIAAGVSGGSSPITGGPLAGGSSLITREAAPDRSDAGLVQALKAVFTAPEQRQALDDLARLLDERPRDERHLEYFKHLMRRLAAGPDAAEAPEDSGEQAGLMRDDPLCGDPFEVFERFAGAQTGAPPPACDGAAGFGDRFQRLWDGAREALRAASYWQMKKRAGVVGKEGLGPLIGRIHAAQPSVRVHLIGHSFGARLVSFALAGLPDLSESRPQTADGGRRSAVGGRGRGGQAERAASASPVKSVVLLQGGFSHFAFASALPHAPARGGALAGMARRVDGPLVVSHSVHDTAVGRFYPLASIVSQDDAAALDGRLFRWAAMGHDGAQAVGARSLPLGPVGQAYPFAPGQFVNLDGDAVIKEGPPPAGAHGDIFHPQLAWATLAAAGLVDPPELRVASGDSGLVDCQPDAAGLQPDWATPQTQPDGALRPTQSKIRGPAPAGDPKSKIAAGGPGRYVDTTIIPALQRAGLQVVDLRDRLPRNQDWPLLREWDTRPPEAITLFAWHYPALPERPPGVYDEAARWAAFARSHIARVWGRDAQGNDYHAPTITYHLGIGGSAEATPARVFVLNDVEAATWHAAYANGIALGIVVDVGQSQVVLPAQAAAMQRVADVLSSQTPDIPADWRENYGHGELTDWGNATACPGDVLAYVRRYRATGSMFYGPPPPGDVPMPLLNDTQIQQVAADVWGSHTFVPGHAIPDAWVAELRAGRYRGQPLTGEVDVGDDSAGKWQRFEYGLAVWLPGWPVSWNG